MRISATVSLALASAALVLVSCKDNKNKGGDSTQAAPSASAPAASAAPTVAPPAAAPASAGGAGFEGAITLRVTEGTRPPTDLTFLTKGSKLRVEMPAHGGHASYAIFDAATGLGSVVVEATKTAIPIRPPAAAEGEDQKPPVVKRTGAHERVAAHDCEDWDVAEPNGKHDALCVAEGIPFFDFGAVAPGGKVPSFGGWLKGAGDQKVFPLRAIISDTTGAIESRVQATLLDAHPLDDSLFVVPAGYKTMPASAAARAPSSAEAPR